MRPLAVLFALALASCASPGACAPDDSHLDLVYDSQGVPAFAGQAMIVESCGYGGFCHSSDEIPIADRIGAPVGLNFDLRVASASIGVEAEATQQLGLNQTRVAGMRDDIWFQVSTGSMPPPGDEYHRRLTEGGMAPDRHAFVGSDGSRTPLPDIASDEGREIVRNFLACGAPVVERVLPAPRGTPEADNPVGFTVPTCEVNCVDATWPSIHENILVASCAFGDCHDSTDSAGDLDFTGDSMAVYSRLVGAGRTSEGGQCAGRGDYITPMDLDASLLYEKVSVETADDTCGSVMPLAGNRLTEQRLCALRAWIECGAPADAGTTEQMTCIEGRREACNIPAAGSADGTCRAETVCAPRL